MIDREHAIKTLYAMTESGLLNEELEEDLIDVANCIAAEEDGLHLWNADDHEVAELYTTVGGDEPFIREHEALCDKLYKKYRFEPSKFEQERQVELNESEEE